MANDRYYNINFYVHIYANLNLNSRYLCPCHQYVISGILHQKYLPLVFQQARNRPQHMSLWTRSLTVIFPRCGGSWRSRLSLWRTEGRFPSPSSPPSAAWTARRTTSDTPSPWWRVRSPLHLLIKDFNLCCISGPPNFDSSIALIAPLTQTLGFCWGVDALKGLHYSVWCLPWLRFWFVSEFLIGLKSIIYHLLSSLFD